MNRASYIVAETSFVSFALTPLPGWSFAQPGASGIASRQRGPATRATRRTRVAIDYYGDHAAGGTVTAAGAVNTNLVETTVGALTGTVLTTDPGLAQRGQFSGKINVVPNSASPVVNVGDGANSLATDWPGVPRPQRGTVDIGGYEFAFRDFGDANDQSAGGSVPGLAEAGSEFRVSEQGADGDTTLDARDPSVAFDSVNNRYLVVFQGEPSNSEEEIFGQIINAADGTTFVDDFELPNRAESAIPAWIPERPTSRLTAPTRVTWPSGEQSGSMVKKKSSHRLSTPLTVASSLTTSESAKRDRTATLQRMPARPPSRTTV